MGGGGPGALPAPGVQRSTRPPDSFSDSLTAALLHSKERFQTNNSKPVNELPVSVCLTVWLSGCQAAWRGFCSFDTVFTSHDMPRPNRTEPIAALSSSTRFQKKIIDTFFLTS